MEKEYYIVFTFSVPSCPSMWLANYMTATRPVLAVSGLGNITAINFTWGPGLQVVWLPTGVII